MGAQGRADADEMLPIHDNRRHVAALDHVDRGIGNGLTEYFGERGCVHERFARLGAHPRLIDLALQLHDPVDERLGTRRTSRHVHVHWDDLVDALDD
jgi:hypothetical protein